MMTVPLELVWLVSIVIPFIIGLFVGALIKRAMKLIYSSAAF